MFDPEYYMSEYKVRDLSSGKIRIASGRYRDFADTGAREEILHDDSVTDERQTFYCVTVPGEAAWVQDAKKKEYLDMAPNLQKSASACNPNPTAKRSLDETEISNGEEFSIKVSPGATLKSETQEKMDISDETEQKCQGMETSGGPSAKKRTRSKDDYTEIDYKQNTGINNPTNRQQTGAPPSINLPIPNSKGMCFTKNTCFGSIWFSQVYV